VNSTPWAHGARSAADSPNCVDLGRPRSEVQVQRPDMRANSVRKGLSRGARRGLIISSSDRVTVTIEPDELIPGRHGSSSPALRDNGEEDLFVHISAIERSGLTALSEGDRVVVDIAEGRKGPEATRIRWA
jgi:cold shock CspA family protein